ncbi:MAG TPA: non-heme iron oxygenase ferredoxin subunit [Planctomycetota bacterium]|nr:non-heme iron oxygenase ferredoxin subunit [Planctomycetota bacterium]
MPFEKACASSELAEGAGKCVTLRNKRIALFRVHGKVHAIDDTCTHDEASLAEGTLIDDDGRCVVECPWHGAHFDLCTGAALTLPAVTPVRAYAVRETNGAIEVEI